MVPRPPRNKDPWFPGLPPGPEARLALFCFCHAGGGASAYREWVGQLHPALAVRPVQYPGREQRFNEPACQSMDALAEGVLAALEPHTGTPFAFFGHSLGGLLAYELTQRLLARGGPLPAHVFISAARAPHTALPREPLYDLPDDELLARLRTMGGTPQRVLDEPELMQLFLPLLRADFTIADTYRRPAEDPLLPVPVTTFEGAEDDEVNPEKIAAWSERVGGRHGHVRLPGDHFFLQTSRDRVLEVVERELLGALG